MWTLIKGAFWFSLVLVLLPIFDKSEQPANEKANVDVGVAVSAATGALSYVTSLCAERPDVCIQGAQTVEALGHRAKDGARVAYSLLDEQFSDDKTAKLDKSGKTQLAADATITGSLPASHIPVPTRRPAR